MQNNDNISENLIAGRNPVIELLRSERSVDKIFMLKEGGGSLTKIAAMAKQRGIPVKEVNREKLNDITFWSEDRFLVKMGDAGLMAEKVALVDGAVSTQLGSRETGILHVSSENGIKIEFEYRIFE